MTDEGMLSDVVVASDGGGLVMDDDIGTKQGLIPRVLKGTGQSLAGDTSASPGREVNARMTRHSSSRRYPRYSNAVFWLSQSIRFGSTDRICP